MTAFVITGIESWVLSVLNSSVCSWFYDQISPKIQNGYYRFKAQYCKQIPIPDADTSQRAILGSLVALMSLGGKAKSASEPRSAPEYERLLNGLVYELFFPEDLHAKNIHLFDACAAAGIGNWPQPEAQGADTSKGKADVARVAFAMAANSTAEEIFHPRHPIYGMLFELQTLEVVRLIESQP